MRSYWGGFDVVDALGAPPVLQLEPYYSPQPGHSCFGDSKDVFRDLRMLLLWGLSAAQRAEHGSLVLDPAGHRQYTLCVQQKPTAVAPVNPRTRLWQRKLRQLFAV